MIKAHRFLIVFMAALFSLGIALVSYQLVMAKGNFSKIIISGDDLTTEIEITDESLLGFFSFSYFPTAEIDEPTVSNGYTITRGSQMEDGSFAVFDQLHYYFKSKGSGGYVYYDGLVNGSSEYDGQWYTASPEADAAIRRIVSAENSDSSDGGNLSFVPGIATLVLASLATAIFTIRRRRAVSG